VLLNRIAVKIAFFVNGFIYASWISRLPRIQEIYHIDNGITGLVLLASSIGAVGAMPFTGWVIIKNGSRRITLFSAILYCAILPFISIMPGVVALVILFFAMGIVTGMLDVAMNAQAVMVEQQYKRPIMTSFHALFSIGMTLGAWSGALFVYLSTDLLLHFSAIVVASLIGVVWAAKNLIRDAPRSSTNTSNPLFRLPTSQLLNVGLIAFCCMLGEGAIGDWSVNYMKNITHAPKTLSPIGLSAFALAMTLGRIFGDRVRATIGDKKLITLGGIIATTGMSITLFFPFPYAAIIGFFLTGIGLSTIVPIAYSLAGNAKGLSSEVALAMVTTVGYSGFLLGPPVIGFLADWQTLRVALILVGALFILMTVLGFQYKEKT
jgi:MFS family permease